MERVSFSLEVRLGQGVSMGLFGLGVWVVMEFLVFYATRDARAGVQGRGFVQLNIIVCRIGKITRWRGIGLGLVQRGGYNGEKV